MRLQGSHERPVAVPSPAERKKLAIALRQLEWADVYLGAIINLELADPSLRRSVHEIRAQLVTLEGRLLRLHDA